MWELSCRNLLMVKHYCRRTAGFILRCNVGDDNRGLVRVHGNRTLVRGW